MVREYAQEVNELRKLNVLDLEKIKIIGEQSMKYHYPFAKNHIGYIVGEVVLFDGTPGYRIFTGVRIWHVTKDDVHFFNKK